jgi:hypothetical protein
MSNNPIRLLALSVLFLGACGSGLAAPFSGPTPQFSAPEPGSMSLVGLSLIGIAFLLGKRVRQ